MPIQKEMSIRNKQRHSNIMKERTKCEIWSRVVGYLRPTSKWNDGKLEEYKDRKVFTTTK